MIFKILLFTSHYFTQVFEEILFNDFFSGIILTIHFEKKIDKIGLFIFFR